MEAVIALIVPDGYARPRDVNLKDLATNRRAWAWSAGLLVVGAAAALIPPLSVPAGVAILILTLSFPSARRYRTPLIVVVTLSATGTLVGLVRFALSNAMLGIVETGQSITATTALSKLREIVSAEDAQRRTARWDPDHDGIGSAALVGALAGALPMRPGAPPSPALLSQEWQRSVETPTGPAALVDGYLFIVCLPAASGGFSARPDQAVDDELAERRFVAYAWPSELAGGIGAAFFADEHERLAVVDPPRGTPPPFFGAARPPSCDEALGPRAGDWKPWKNKQPRERLPGDKP
jgi:hypothetical protein